MSGAAVRKDKKRRELTASALDNTHGATPIRTRRADAESYDRMVRERLRYMQRGANAGAR